MKKGFTPVKQATIKRVEIKDSIDNDAIKEINESKQSIVESNDLEPKTPTKEQLDPSELINQAVQATAKVYDEKIKQQVSQLEQQYQAQLETLEQKANQELSELNSKLSVLEQEKAKAVEIQNKVEELLKMTGNPNPVNIVEKNINFNTQTSVNSTPRGAFAEAIQVLESSPKTIKPYDKYGEFIEDYDRINLDRFLLQNRESVLEDMTAWGRKTYGWFQNNKPIKEAATTISDLPGGFLQILSSLVRQTHRSGLIWHQFTTMRYDADARLQQNIAVPRVNYLTSSTDPADYLLSGGGTYADIATTNDNIATGITSIAVQEYGRGKSNAGTAISPVSIPNFVSFYSAYDLLSIVQRLLGRDYFVLEDNLIRSQYNLTSVTLYNAGDGVATAASSLGVGDGLMTRNFLQDIYEYLYNQQVLRFPDDSYIVVLPYRAIKQLKRSYNDEWEAASVSDLQELTDMLIPREYPNYFDGKISGYQGKVDNCHIFEAGSGWGTGAAATPGVTSEATGGTGNSVMRQGWAFGDGAVGQGVSMPFTIVPSELTNFGRKKTWTWLSWQGVEAMDVDPTGTSDSNQQLRVVKIKTADVAVV